MPFDFEEFMISGLVLVRPKRFQDSRGFFVETYKHSEFASRGINEQFVQDNYSSSQQGTLRGLHYQKAPAAQGKLVTCLRGRIYDVAVDIRRGSPFFGKWAGVELTDENGLLLYVPPGFAHGFLVLSDRAEVLYKCTQEYSPDHERGIIWNDPEIGIQWQNSAPMLSPKDKELPFLREADMNFSYSG
ncbi:MAG: dTDP-4-dehydrorhamnose 3,5-epimerase [Nitrospirae bacterium GWC2_57_13]|jgi:dTDP-4-dehydrorhamnose 3,5-epimerase|nr:MAG: dTDP-4-dehydrorhamnose 3,5-epimerase [Nitrospirae bacterium GWC1_57_7]OGW27856.1 MAG: dTDP-4-dehydrorhamnose 3,5-epimerase [Nitrospirae bacterium GWC2_57_13]